MHATESISDRVYRLGKFKLRVKINNAEVPTDLPPLLLCNGYGLPLDVLDPIVDKLAGLTVIRFDAPGIGGSPGTLLPYRFSTLASLLDQLLERGRAPLPVAVSRERTHLRHP